MVRVYLIENFGLLGLAVVESQCTEKGRKLFAIDVARVIDIEYFKCLLEYLNLLGCQLLFFSLVFLLVW